MSRRTPDSSYGHSDTARRPARAVLESGPRRVEPALEFGRARDVGAGEEFAAVELERLLEAVSGHRVLRGNVNAAVNILNAFINQSEAIFINRNCNGTELSGVCHDIRMLIGAAQAVARSLA